MASLASEALRLFGRVGVVAVLLVVVAVMVAAAALSTAVWEDVFCFFGDVVVLFTSFSTVASWWLAEVVRGEGAARFPFLLFCSCPFGFA